MGKLRLIALGAAACVLIAACGAGLPPEEHDAPPLTAQGCAAANPNPLQFVVNAAAASLFWAADSRIDLTDPTTDQSKIKLIFDIPQDQLPTGISQATIQVQAIPDRFLIDTVHVDTVFQISAIEPSDLPGFSGSGQTQLRLAIRYDPVACEIAPEIESNLVLGRLNPENGAWLEVCGDTANTGLAVHEVSCSDGDLSFGIFGVIPRVGNPSTDVTPPVFPTPSFSLNSPSRCSTCVPTSIELAWGPASDGGGSGIKGYWIYVDSVRTVFTSDITATPAVHFTLRSSGTIDTAQEHLYQVQAVDNNDNVSTLFGALRT